MTANTHSSTTGKVDRIPFDQRPTCSVDDAVEASGLSRSLLYQKMKAAELAFTKVGKRRLVQVQSLLQLLEVS
jgi:hypothetical protein